MKLKYIPYIVLMASFILRFIYIWVFPMPYWYDEIVFISFSKQSFPDLLQTLTAEPHPPVFFLFLKLLPIDNIVLTRTILLLTTYLLSIISLMHAQHYKLLEKYNLNLGIALFFSSYTFLETSMYVKDAVISTPLVLITLFSLL